MPCVSIIVPVYNVEPYLEKCLTSLVNQTLHDYEIIVINDGSLDHSQAIIDLFYQQYPELIKPYIKENGGLSSARNFGIAHAKGDYIGFVDSDDWVEESMFDTMYQKALNENFDLVICDAKLIFPNKVDLVTSGLNQDIITKIEIKRAFLTLYPTSWNKLYKRDLFDKGVLFKEGIWFEDVEFLYRILPYVYNIGVIPKALYNYLQRNDAISKTISPKLFDYLNNWNGVVSFYREKGLLKEYFKELEYAYVRYVLATFLKNAIRIKDKTIRNKAIESAFSGVKLNFPNYKKNSYFYQSGYKGFYLLIINKPFVYLISSILPKN